MWRQINAGAVSDDVTASRSVGLGQVCNLTNEMINLGQRGGSFSLNAATHHGNSHFLRVAHVLRRLMSLDEPRAEKIFDFIVLIELNGTFLSPFSLTMNSRRLNKGKN